MVLDHGEKPTKIAPSCPIINQTSFPNAAYMATPRCARTSYGKRLEHRFAIEPTVSWSFFWSRFVKVSSGQTSYAIPSESRSFPHGRSRHAADDDGSEARRRRSIAACTIG